MNNGDSRIQMYSPIIKKHFKIKNCQKKPRNLSGNFILTFLSQSYQKITYRLPIWHFLSTLDHEKVFQQIK